MRIHSFLFLTLFFYSIKLYSQTSIFISTTDQLRGMLIINDNLYFCNFSKGKILKVDLTSTNPLINEVYSGLSGPRAIELYGNTLYICEYYGNKISKINLSVNNPILENVVTGLNYPSDILISGDEMYISEGNKISKINLLSSSPIVNQLVNGLGCATSIAIQGNDLYISDECLNKIYKLNLTNINPTITDVISGTGNRGIAINSNNLYVADNKGVSKKDLTQNNSQLINIASGFCCVPGDIITNGYILYTTELQSGKIYKSILNSISGNVGINTNFPLRNLHVNDILRIEPRNSAPSNPGEGDVYYDAILHKLRVYDGTIWQNCW